MLQKTKLESTRKKRKPTNHGQTGSSQLFGSSLDVEQDGREPRTLYSSPIKREENPQYKVGTDFSVKGLVVAKKLG